MSLMTRSGRLDRGLVVEAIAACAPQTKRMRLMARLRSAAETKGAVSGAQLVAVLVEDDVTDPVELVLDSPVPLDPGGDGLGLGVGHG